MSDVKKGNYGYSRTLAIPFDQAVERVTARSRRVSGSSPRSTSRPR